MNTIPQIFNRASIRKRRNRASAKINEHDFLLQEVGDAMVAKLEDLSGGFQSILVIGCGADELSPQLEDLYEPALLVSQDLSDRLLARIEGNKVVADEELLPYAEGSFDLVVSNLSLHLVNDLPGTLVQIRKILKPNGVFIASLFGIETLKELRKLITEVEVKLCGGASPRIAPFSDLKTMGQLLQRAGFALPVADGEVIQAAYDNVTDLLHDLRFMGETHPLAANAKPLTRAIMTELTTRYAKQFGDGEGGILATFDIIGITGLAAANKP